VITQMRDGIRKKRKDSGYIRLTAADESVLNWTADHYALTYDDVARLYGRPGPALTSGATRMRVDRLRKAGLVIVRKVFVDTPPFVWSTAAGLRAVNRPFTSKTPSISLLRHVSAVTSVRLGLEEQFGPRRVAWTSERYLRHGHGLGQEHVPDGLAAVAVPGRALVVTAAIEVDLSPKPNARLQTIAEHLASRYLEIWVYAPSGSEPHAAWVRLAAKTNGLFGGRIDVRELP
jgi:hypothetical protein